MGRFHWVDVDCFGPGHDTPATAQEPCCQSSAYTGMHTGEEVVSKIATLRGHEAPVVDICFADAWRCRLDRFCMFLLRIFGDVCERQPYFLQGQLQCFTFNQPSGPRAHFSIIWFIISCSGPIRVVFPVFPRRNQGYITLQLPHQRRPLWQGCPDVAPVPMFFC